MRVLVSASCEARDICARLRHSWLEHMVLERDADRVAEMHAAKSESREAFEQLIKPDGDFFLYLCEAYTLLQNITDDFSPAELVEQSALGQLPKDMRVLLREILHTAYLSQSRIEIAVDQTKDLVEDLSNDLREFANAWFRIPPSDYDTVKTTFQRVQKRAGVLHEILGRLPKGIVLP